jgi:hydrogenase maturation protease
MPVVVIGVGNEFRRDDGAGPAVLRELRDLVPSGVELVLTDGEPTRLLEAWTGAALAVVVDAVRVSGSEPRPGTAHRFVVDRPGAGGRPEASSHGFGLDDAVALALALDRMPGRLIVHAIEAADLSQGSGLTAPVAAAVGTVAAAILDDIGSYCRTPGDLVLCRHSRLWPTVYTRNCESAVPAAARGRRIRASVILLWPGRVRLYPGRRWSRLGGTPASGRPAPCRLR